VLGATGLRLSVVSNTHNYTRLSCSLANTGQSWWGFSSSVNQNINRIMRCDGTDFGRSCVGRCGDLLRRRPSNVKNALKTLQIRLNGNEEPITIVGHLKDLHTLMDCFMIFIILRNLFFSICLHPCKCRSRYSYY
jgi:hypothetical protein